MKLWLDDLRPIPREEEWVLARSVNEAVAIMGQHEISFASLDHDLGDWSRDGGDGVKFVLWTIENEVWPKDGLEVHSMNPVGAENMISLINQYAPYRGTRRTRPF